MPDLHCKSRTDYSKNILRSDDGPEFKKKSMTFTSKFF